MDIFNALSMIGGLCLFLFGMEAMSGAVKGLKDVPEFLNLFLLFRNPVLGVLAGALLTAIIQSSSASVGILQALSATGQVTIVAAIPTHHGAEYRYMCYSTDLLCRCQQKRQARIDGAFDNQYHWSRNLSGFLYVD